MQQQPRSGNLLLCVRVGRPVIRLTKIGTQWPASVCLVSSSRVRTRRPSRTPAKPMKAYQIVPATRNGPARAKSGPMSLPAGTPLKTSAAMLGAIVDKQTGIQVFAVNSPKTKLAPKAIAMNR